MMAKLKPPVKKNDQLKGTVVDFTFLGMGVIKVENYPIFIANTIIDEEVEFVVTKVTANYAFGKVLSIIKASKNRVENLHPQLINSGIAPLIHIEYPEQLKLKQNQIIQLFKKQGITVEVDPTIGMDDPTHYRNKTVVPIKNQDGKLVTGFYRRGSHRLVSIEDYYLNDRKIDQTVGLVRDILQKYFVQAYDDESKTGSIRYIMVRRGYYSHQLMVVLVSAKKKIPNQDEIIKDIQAAVPELKSLILNYNPRQTNVQLGDDNKVLFGEDHITDSLLGKQFVIGPNSFYQVNPQTTEVLYALAAKKANLKANQLVIDAYSGIGTIGISVADQVEKVIGVEVVEPAVEDAKANAKQNNIKNIEFIQADAPQQFIEWQTQGIKPDVIFVDPPRKGLTEELINAVSKIKPETFIYISCNPATLARDAKQLIEKGYRIDGPITPIDQFPQTTHVESITVFKSN